MLVAEKENRKERKMYWDAPVDITLEGWMEILRDEKVTKEKDLEILDLYYRTADYSIRPEIAAMRLGWKKEAIAVTRPISDFSKRVVAKTGITPPDREGGGSWWWHVPFMGHYKHEPENRFYYFLRPELAVAYKLVFCE